MGHVYKEENKITERELYAMYDDFLNDVYGEVEIMGMKYETSYAIKDLDPVAYKCGFNDWLDSQLTDGIYTEEGDEIYETV